MYVTDETLRESLLNMSTAFIGRVVSVNTATATASVQPLSMMKQFGSPAKKRAPIQDVPILHHVGHWKLVKQSLTVTDTYTGGGSISPNPHPAPANQGHIQFDPIRAGDIVFCVCADREISATRKGQFATPALGHHEISNAVIVGLIV